MNNCKKSIQKYHISEYIEEWRKYLSV